MALKKQEIKELFQVKRNPEHIHAQYVAENLANAHRALQELDFTSFVEFMDRANKKHQNISEHLHKEANRILANMKKHNLSVEDARRLKNVWYLR